MDALTAAVIGFLGIYIAWRQWETSAYRLKLDLFEKRFAIYEATIDFILSIRGGGKVLDENLSVFKEKTLAARFIFDDKIADYIKEIREKSIDLQTCSKEQNGNIPEDERLNCIHKQAEIKKWLYRQVEESQLNKTFGSFLTMTPNRKWINSILNWIKISIVQKVSQNKHRR